MLLGLVVLVLVAFYANRAASVVPELGESRAEEAYYNRLVAGFKAGRLSLDMSVPDGLNALPDPYDPEQNRSYRGLPYLPGGLHDVSFYRGQLHLYFGAPPALLVFWPFNALTGRSLSHAQVVVFFCAIGLCASVLLLRAAWRRYFPDVSVLAAGGAVVALGLATSVPLMLLRPEVWEVPISCAYALTMMSLLALWQGLHEPGKVGWLVLAAALYGTAIAARPSLAWSVLVLLWPVYVAWREPNRVGRVGRSMRVLAAIAAPLLVIGGLVAAYNYHRFGNAFEFGQHYQLAGDRQDASTRHFSLAYFWFNLRLYFWAPVTLQTHFPFFGDVQVPALPAGHGAVDRPFGILVNLPSNLFALAALLLIGRRAPKPLGGFVSVVLGIFLSNALVMALFYGTCVRYQVDFNPALTLLAGLGALAGLHRLRGRRVAAASLLFAWTASVLASATVGTLKDSLAPAEAHFEKAGSLHQIGQFAEAISSYRAGLRLHPRSIRGWNGLGITFAAQGDHPAALPCFRQALALEPGFAPAHASLGNSLVALGGLVEARGAFEAALQADPRHVGAHNSLGVLLAREGRLTESLRHFEVALRIDGSNTHVHVNRGVVLMALGEPAAARAALTRALELDPANPDARHLLQRLDASTDAALRAQ